MNLAAIRDELTKLRSAVIRTNELSRVSAVNQKTTLQYAIRMVKKGLLIEVEKGKYALTSDPFEVASRILSPSYISFTAGLYLYGYVDQEVNSITVVSSKKHRDISFIGTKISFVKVNPRLMFGIKKIICGKFYILIGEPEKIIIDILYMPRNARINCLSKVLKDSDIKKLVNFARRTDSNAVYRRLGYILEFFDIKNDIKPVGSTKYKLNPSIKNKGKYNSKWRLYINDEL